MSASTSASQGHRDAEVQTDGWWLGSQERPLLGWLSRPREAWSHSGVLLLPPVGYPYLTSHRTLRCLAEGLAQDGQLALRVDYDGTGDSAGDQWDPARLQAWRATVGAGVAELRGLGAQRITLVGTRLGGTLALLEAGPLEVDRVVAWLPVLSGRRFVKELRLLSVPVPEEHDPLTPPGTLVQAGNVFSAETLSTLAAIGESELAAFPPPSILVIDDPGGSAASLVTRLRDAGAEVTHELLSGSEQALETPTEFATVPGAVIDSIRAWIGSPVESSSFVLPSTTASIVPPTLAQGHALDVRLEPRASLAWRGGRLDEEVLRLPGGHVGILAEPHGGRTANSSAILALLNPGSESHVGPGRAWVELARDLALRGQSSFRVDYLGWGESPDAGRAPGRPYDLCCEQDTLEIVEGLRSLGHERVVLFGLCASAWIALRAAAIAPPAAVIALNPQLYWRRGDPVEIDWDLIRARRAREIERIERGARLGLWTLLDRLGHRPPAGRWLDELAATGIPVRLLFTEGDDGRKFLTERLSRRLARLTASTRMSVEVIPQLDHPLHRAWLRPRLTDAVLAAVQAAGC